MRRRSAVVRLVIALTALGLLAGPAAVRQDTARAGEVPEGAEWSETFIPTADPTITLHADILRPAHLPETAKTPVIMSIGPYFGHADEGGITGAPGPSSRFQDLYDAAQLAKRGYTFVLVDLRGYGGSGGCLDIFGEGEQADVVTAVEWAAKQPWSTGKVGLYGKSYDAITGFIGTALRPKGLAAVVAQQSFADTYSGVYYNGVRQYPWATFPAVTYGSSGELGWSTQDNPLYIANALSRTVDCQPQMAGWYVNRKDTPFWQVRDLGPKAKGSTVPTFTTYGFLDANTMPGGRVMEFMAGLKGPKRAWVGWWDHVRGNDIAPDTGELAMGRAGWFAEVIRFYDEHLKGIKPRKADPAFVVQDQRGRWRAEKAWPPVDARSYVAPLLAGTYVDDGQGWGSPDDNWNGLAYPTGQALGEGAWTFSSELRGAVHLAGIGSVSADVDVIAAQTNVVADLYDVSPDGIATIVTRGAMLMDVSGKATFDLWPADWVFPKGHRIGLLVTGANSETFQHVATQTTVTVNGGTVSLPLLAKTRKAFLPGQPASRLLQLHENAPFEVDPDVIGDRTQRSFAPPPSR